METGGNESGSEAIAVASVAANAAPSTLHHTTAWNRMQQMYCMMLIESFALPSLDCILAVVLLSSLLALLPLPLLLLLPLLPVHLCIHFCICHRHRPSSSSSR